MDPEVTSESATVRDASDVAAEPVAEAVDERAHVDGASLDLDVVERDLDDVQAALVRLNDGEYWTDEVTGQPLPDEFLADSPTARTVAPSA